MNSNELAATNAELVRAGLDPLPAGLAHDPKPAQPSATVHTIPVRSPLAPPNPDGAGGSGIANTEYRPPNDNPEFIYYGPHATPLPEHRAGAPIPAEFRRLMNQANGEFVTTGDLGAALQSARSSEEVMEITKTVGGKLSTTSFRHDG